MKYQYQMIIVMAIASALLRFAPFAIFAKNKKLPRQLINLAKNLPMTAMGMLVVYCLKDVSINNCLPELIAILFVALSYAYKKNNLISIFGGTLIYLVIVNFLI